MKKLRTREDAYSVGILQLISGRVRIGLEVHLTAKSRLFSPCTFASQLLPGLNGQTRLILLPTKGLSSFLPPNLCKCPCQVYLSFFLSTYEFPLVLQGSLLDELLPQECLEMMKSVHQSLTQLSSLFREPSFLQMCFILSDLTDISGQTGKQSNYINAYHWLFRKRMETLTCLLFSCLE